MVAQIKDDNCAVIFLSNYLKFKESCVNAQIFNLDEIIKLYEIWINSNR